MLLATALSVHCQGTFQNLDFESATLSPVPAGQFGGEVSITAALPGWSGEIGDTPVSQVLQNNSTTGAASIDILGPNWGGNPGIIDGNYSVFLQAGAPDGPGSENSTSIWQTGTVPADSESLQVKAWSYFPNAPFSVSFNGNTLLPVALSTGQSPSGQAYTLYGFNIASYASQTGQLQLSAIFSDSGPSWTEFDDITFSTQVVPEPSVVALTAIGGLLFGARRWFARR